MPITPIAFVNSRRFAFHVCGAINFESIRRKRTLRSASEILEGTAHQHLLQGKRSQTKTVDVSGNPFQIRDHKPLILANIELLDSCSLNDFINELNSRVFLWAGTEAGPCTSGKNHIRKYQDEGDVFIFRTPTRRLLELNSVENLEITFCNSGSARQHAGIRAKRGHSTFMALENATQRPGDVVEITFRRSALLPAETEYAKELTGPWLTIATDA
jgi:hypothetical protein